jgi:hypothetical protein
MTELASKIREEAKSASGDQASQMDDLADKLDTAARTGDLSGLQPPQGGPPPGPPPGASDASGDSSGSADSSSSASDASSSAASGTSSTSEARKAASAYASNMPTPLDLLNPILSRSTSASSTDTSSS